MTDIDSPQRLPQETLAETVFVWFQRVVACYCLLVGALYWVRLIGVHDGPLWRFDLMPLHWQVAAAILAVLFPFAASGLWMLASWGPVIWLICVATEVAMYAGFPDLFGRKPAVLSVHFLVALSYIACKTAIYRQKQSSDFSTSSWGAEVLSIVKSIRFPRLR